MLIEIKPSQWRDLPGLVSWLEVEAHMQGAKQFGVKVMQSDSFDAMLASAPLHLPLLELLLVKATHTIYTFNVDEVRHNKLGDWANDQSKWTPEMAKAVSPQLLTALLDKDRCYFLLTIGDKKTALTAVRKLGRHWDNTVWNRAVIAILRRKDMTPAHRMFWATRYRNWNAQPHMMSVMYGHLGFTIPETIQILETLRNDQSGNAASSNRFTQVVRLLRKEAGICPRIPEV